MSSNSINTPSLGKDELNEIFQYCEGRLYWKISPHPRIKVGSEAGHYTSGYLNVELFKKTWKAHRIVWIMHFGEIPEGMLIDHINGVGTDNRVSNLRLATRAENGRNAKKRRTSKSKYKGVSWHARQGKWNAVIQVDGVRHHIASFDTELEAHKAYCEVAEKIFGEFFNNGGENE
jgi:hypothetical protein